MENITEYFHRLIRFALLLNSNCKTVFSQKSFNSLLVTPVCLKFDEVKLALHIEL